MQFGISTHLYHSVPLGEQHLREIADHGFDRVELFACHGHFDYTNPAAIDTLARQLDATGLTLHSVHCPIVDSLAGERWGHAYNNAAPHAAVRQQAVDQAVAALELARTVPYRFLVVHLGLPDSLRPAPSDNDRQQAKRSIEDLHEVAGRVGVRLALEIIPNDLSTPESLARLIEDELEMRDAGICLDFGHAFLMGDLVDAIETTSGHLLTTHVHDNRGRTDDHLVPFDGHIDWLSALMAMQKVGYEDTLLFELQSSEPAGTVLTRVRSVRERFEQILDGEWGPL